MRPLTSKIYYNFCRQNYLRQKQDKQKLGSIEGYVIEKRKMGMQSMRKYKQNLPSQKMHAYYKDNLVQLTLYMNHDTQKSLYLFYILNFQKVGFRRVSDLAFLDSASYNYNLRSIPDQERWPLLRFSQPLGKPVILKGFEQIYGYLGKRNCLQFQIQSDDNLRYAEQFVDNQVATSLETLFWHPTLTFQYSFHTDISSYYHNMVTDILVGVIYRNTLLIAKRVFRNLQNIRKNKQQYMNSKQKLIKSLKQVEKILNGKQYFGGEKPHHFDFYLFALLKTKWSSKHFRHFLQNQIGKQFWSWFLRISSKTQYDKQRVTLI